MSYETVSHFASSLFFLVFVLGIDEQNSIFLIYSLNISTFSFNFYLTGILLSLRGEFPFLANCLEKLSPASMEINS